MYFVLVPEETWSEFYSWNEGSDGESIWVESSFSDDAVFCVEQSNVAYVVNDVSVSYNDPLEIVVNDESVYFKINFYEEFNGDLNDLVVYGDSKKAVLEALTLLQAC